MLFIAAILAVCAILAACSDAPETPAPVPIVVAPPTAAPPPVPPTSTPPPTATVAPSATPSPTHTPTATPSPTPTATATPSPTSTPSPTPTRTATPIPTSTSTPSPTATFTPTPTNTATATPTPIPPTATPTNTATPAPPTATPTPTNTPIPPKPGEIVWKFRTGGWIEGAPLVADGTVYIGSQDRSLYALNALTGEVEWEYEAGGRIGADAVAAGGAIIAADLDGRLHAVDRETGARIWTTESSSEIWGKVSANESAAFAANKDGHVIAAGLEDGSELWRFEALETIYGGAAVVGNSVLATSHDDWVYSIDSQNGALNWKTEMRSGSNSTPLFANGLIIVGSWDDRLYAMNAATGANVWNFWAGGAIIGGAVASENAVFFGADDGYAYSVSLEDGSLNWRRELGEQVHSTPALDVGILYIASGDTLFALDAANGAEVWTRKLGGVVGGGALTVANGVVYAGARDRHAYAIAAGFPDDYQPPDTATPTPTFQPLSPSELREKLPEVFGSNDKVLGNVAVFDASGKTVYWRDESNLIIEVFENGYYLLTGRTIQQDGWEARYYAREDYDRLADERNDPGLKRFVGWCCIWTGGDSRLQLVMAGDKPQNAAFGTTAHEAGHAFQRLLNPAQNKSHRDSLMGALREAEAYTFEVALIRKIGEYAEVETAQAPGTYWDPYLAWARNSMRDATTDLSEEHDRGRLIMWQAVLHDPDLAHLRSELERNGKLSADSLLEMYYKLVSLTPSEVEPYIEFISTQAPLSDDLNYFAGVVKKRTGFAIEYPDLVLNALILLTSP